MLHELWVDVDGLETFCPAGPTGDDARSLLKQPATLVWTVEARNHDEAMTLYYDYKSWGEYPSIDPEIEQKYLSGAAIKRQERDGPHLMQASFALQSQDRAYHQEPRQAAYPCRGREPSGDTPEI